MRVTQLGLGYVLPSQFSEVCATQREKPSVSCVTMASTDCNVECVELNGLPESGLFPASFKQAVEIVTHVVHAYTSVLAELASSRESNLKLNRNEAVKKAWLQVGISSVRLANCLSCELRQTVHSLLLSQRFM